MASRQATEFANFLESLSRSSANPDSPLTPLRYAAESIHLATKEPEDVTYAEVDAGGVDALWCIPTDSAPDAVLLHTHMGGSVLMSMHSDRKAAAHIAKAAGARSLVLNFRRSPEHLNTRHRSTMSSPPTTGCLSRATRPRRSPVSAIRSAATSRSRWR